MNQNIWHWQVGTIDQEMAKRTWWMCKMGSGALWCHCLSNFHFTSYCSSALTPKSCKLVTTLKQVCSIGSPQAICSPQGINMQTSQAPGLGGCFHHFCYCCQVPPPSSSCFCCCPCPYLQGSGATLQCNCHGYQLAFSRLGNQRTWL